MQDGPTEKTGPTMAGTDGGAAILSAIVDSTDDAIVSKTVDGIITSWNRAAEKMFGYSANEVIGRSIRLIIPPELQAEEDYVLLTPAYHSDRFACRQKDRTRGGRRRMRRSARRA